MAQRNKPQIGGHDFFEHIGDEHEYSDDQDANTWAVSFSDITTVLLVFFLLLMSFSVISPNKYEVVKNEIKGIDIENTNIRELEKDLIKMIEEAKIKYFVEINPDELGLNIEIQDRAMFASGSANLNQSTRELLVRMIRKFIQLPNQYRFLIEGHTDDLPISNPDFRSNWHLSTARALSVLSLFSNSGVIDERLRVEGLADTQPLKGYPLKDKNNNPIPENRERNRRVVIKIR